MSVSHSLHESFDSVRRRTLELCAPLGVEDCVIQTMPDVSPVKWHLAHTTWFFEAFVLTPHLPGYAEYRPHYRELFNSYYLGIGAPFTRSHRGRLSRPSLSEIHEYRSYVDAAVHRLVAGESPPPDPSMKALLELGLHHEEQHQELILTDIKHVLSLQPLRPPYLKQTLPPASSRSSRWVTFDVGLLELGHSGDGFAFDNERPRHQTCVAPFELASSLITNGEYLEFIEDGGYERAELWLDDGWTEKRTEQWQAPLYWELDEKDRYIGMTLGGMQPVDRNAPVAHVSYYEADAFARWRGVRLPTEFEWEVAALAFGNESRGTLLDDRLFHPVGKREQPAVQHLLGEVWEWTRSAYLPYPGFRPWSGILGEYNGKFMSGQMVLRGGSCVTPANHVRTTYRNFFQPNKRWQFSGIRLARDEACHG